MRHRKKSERFSRSRAQRKALVKSLLKAVVINERIKTTTSKAKYLRGEVDQLITLAKTNTLASRRQAFDVLGDHKLVHRLFESIGPRFKNIKGGYTRVLTAGVRKGDGALLSILELTKIEKKAKLRKVKKEKPKEERPEKPEEKKAPKKEAKPKKGLVSGMRKIFKKERDAL
jgi:large subunit ribosomal protein L17